MKDGAVGFHRQENVRRIKVEKNKALVNALEKTKIEDLNPDLRRVQREREEELVREKQRAKQEYAAQERLRQKEQRLKEQDKREYKANVERGIQETIERTRLEQLQLGSDSEESDSDVSEGSLMGF